MKVYREKDEAAVAKRASGILLAVVNLKPDCVLGLATGTTPIPTYQAMIEACRDGRADFSKVHTVNLDEYRGLQHDDPNSYHFFMKDNLFDHINIDPANTNVPDGAEPDAEKACSSYDELIRSLGGIDIQLLGIGHNGHIAFNEPTDHFPDGTHIVDLTQDTIEANSRLFNDISEVPTQAITMGIGSIMSARRILLLATGANKADAVRATLYGPVTPQVPASILRLHPDVTIICDEAALPC